MPLSVKILRKYAISGKNGSKNVFQRRDEVAETPLSGDGLVGQVFNLFLSPISDVVVSWNYTLLRPS